MTALLTKFDEQKLHVRHWGNTEAPAVVLLHGLIMSSRYMIPLGRELATDFRVYAPDLPGFGRSRVAKEILDTEALGAALAQWMRTAGLRDVTLIANSYGCQIATEAVLQGAPVGEMVFIGPTLDPHGASRWRQIGRLAKGILHEPYWFLPLAAWDLAHCGVRRGLRTMGNMLSHDYLEKMTAVRVPVVVVRGENDHVCPQTWAERVVKLLNGSSPVHVVKRGAHVLHGNLPEQIAAVVKSRSQLSEVD